MIKKYNKDELSLIKKKSFLLWVLSKKVENTLFNMSSASKLIQSRPKKVYAEINQFMDEELKTHLEMLSHVGDDDIEYIASLFDNYKGSYSSYLADRAVP